MENKSLSLIKKRMGDIQCGLLRFYEKNKHVSLHVKVSAHDDTFLNCIVDNEVAGKKFMNKKVSLIQKYHNDYLHIVGIVCEEIQKGKRILSVQIERACWFVRHSKGNVSWLQQKYQYEPLGDSMQEMRA
jgi:hypothetical protein